MCMASEHYVSGSDSKRVAAQRLLNASDMLVSEPDALRNELEALRGLDSSERSGGCNPAAGNHYFP